MILDAILSPIRRGIEAVQSLISLPYEKSTGIGRRDFFRLTGAAAASAVLASCNTKTSNSKPITQEEYDGVLSKLQSLGIRLDGENTSFQEGSTTLIVYLPDTHKPDYEKSNAQVLKKIDGAIDFDVMGLETVIGEVSTKRAKDMTKSRKRIREYLVKEHTKLKDLIQVSHKAGFAYDAFHKAITESGHKTEDTPLEKLGLQIAYLYKHQSRAFQDLEVHKGLESEQISHSEISSRSQLKNAYFNLETRAKKIGVEPEEEALISFAEAGATHMYIQALKQGIERVRDLYEQVDKDYTGPELGQQKKTLGETISNYISFLESYIDEAETYRDQILETLTPEQKKAVLDSGFDLDFSKSVELSWGETWTVKEPRRQPSKEFDEFVLDYRTEKWVDKASEYRMVLLPGGAGHRELLTKFAGEKNCSIITLDEIDLSPEFKE
jgi:hypothetical protein